MYWLQALKLQKKCWVDECPLSFVLPKCSCVAVVLLFSTGFALWLISRRSSTADTLRTERRAEFWSGGTAAAEELRWGEDETKGAGVTLRREGSKSCVLKPAFLVHDFGENVIVLIVFPENVVFPLGSFQCVLGHREVVGVDVGYANHRTVKT